MRRWLLCFLGALGGLTLLLVGLLVPAHLRTVDVSVVRAAGQKTPSVTDRGVVLVQSRQLGAAELLLQAARNLQVSGTETFGLSVSNLAEQNPEKLQELHRILDEWRKTIGAPVPNQLNPEFDPEAEREAIREASNTKAQISTGN